MNLRAGTSVLTAVFFLVGVFPSETRPSEGTEASLQAQLNDSDPESYARLGDFYLSHKKLADAERVYLRSLSLQKGRADLFIKTERVQFEQRKFDEAVKTLRLAQKAYPKNESVYEELGRAFEATGNRYEARAVALDRLKNFGEKPAVVSKLCALYSEDSYFKESERYCDRGMKVDPQQPANYVYRAKTHAEAKQRDKALELLRRATEKFPNAEGPFTYMGNFYAEDKNWELAYANYQKAYQISTKDDAVALRFAKVAFQLSRHDDALEAFRQALTLNKKAAVEVRRCAGILRSRKDIALSGRYEKLLLEMGL